MNKSLLKTFALCAAAACVLAACGGGDDPDPTNRVATLTVSNATTASLNGIYSGTLSLSDVQTIARVGATDACEFTFDNLKKSTDSTVTVQGRIRYIKDSNTLNEYSVTITGNGAAPAFARADGVGTSVDRANNQIVFAGSVASSTDTSSSTVTLTGNVPLQFSRPSGC